MNSFTPETPLLMIPGPVKSDDKVLASTAKRTYSHTESAFVTKFQQALLNLREIFDVSDHYSPVVVAGGGTLAMEIAMINLIDTSKDQRVLICETGYFGDRFEALADSIGVESDKLGTETGNAISIQRLDERLSDSDIDFAFIQHVDTSTGVANDIEQFGQICKKHGVISVVDGVCALGGQELRQESWDIDIYLTGAQKALALPPGLAILMYSPQAKKISEERSTKIPSYYADLSNWWPVLDAYIDGKVKYFSTPATNLIAGLHLATELILEEGMDNVYTRHQRLANRFREGLKELGFSFVTHSDCFANTLSTPKYLDPSYAGEFRKKLLDQGILVAGGIQKGFADKYFRVGHMGQVTEKEIDYTLAAIKQAIQ